MEIQRVKFLLLASALAAPACVTTVTDDNTGSGGSTSDASTGGSNTGSGGKSTGGKTGSGGGTGTGGTVASGGADGSTEAGAAGSDGATGNGGAAGKDGGTSDGSAPDGSQPDGACDDNHITGGYGDCSLARGDACSIAQFQEDECNGAKGNMKPFIAQQTIQCILNKASLCNAADTYNCVDQALKIACPDSTADDECAAINTACSLGDGGVDLCRQYLSGMTQAGRNAMVTCMTGNCSVGLYSCVEGL